MELKEEERDAYWLPRIGLQEIYPLRRVLEGQDDLVAIDVGANRGFWSHQFLSYFGRRTKRIELLEPLPGNIEDFKHLKKSGFFDPFSDRLTLHPLAASDKAGQITLNTDGEKSGLASANYEIARFHAFRFKLDKKISAKSIPIDEFMQQNGLTTVHCMKIDTEGHEMSVLKGAQAALKSQSIQAIAFEFGPNSLFSGARFFDFYNLFDGFGYRLNRYHMGARKLIPVETYSTSEETYDDNYTIFATRI
ncbi:MAG: FkbM family methyltransferase [Pseudomonadota bacterium]